MKKIVFRTMPWVLLALFATEVLVALRPRRDKEFHVQEFGRLPVLLGGRVQPFDSVGRNALLQIRSTQAVPLEEKKFWQFWKHPPKLRASEWLLEVMTRPEQADQRPIFLIHHPDLLNELNLRGKGIEKSGLFYFTYDELKPALPEIEKQGQQVAQVESELRTAFQKQVAKLHNAAILYHRLKNSLRPEASDDFLKELSEFEKAIGPGVQAVHAQQAGQEFDKAAFDKIIELLGEYEFISRVAYPLIVPPAHPEISRDEWRNAGQALMEAVRTGDVPQPMRSFAAMATAFRQNRPAEFNRAVDEYREWLSAKFQPELSKGRREFFFNNFQVFLRAMITYLFAFLLAAGSLTVFALWPNLSESLRRSAFYLIALGWVVHTFGLIYRMALEGRPPVTNLYSSAVFIGWAAVAFGLGLERIFKVGLGVAVSALAGFVTLIIAQNLAVGGDTMEMMRAVLDTNFWLATHVVVVTLGYASTFVAGLLAIAYILLGLCSPVLALPAGKLDIGKVLSKMVYGIVCFATLFSFTGTILGGIWADQSWGRFWGWDPKENGALLIVLWNAAYLHARWGRMFPENVLMAMAVFGNIVTSFSWFGVNLLGIGLHSYGFMDRGWMWLGGFMLSQVFLIALALVPMRAWRSFRRIASA
jgi:ABC-type transport system involved in cytochrome c biogenesis permease subunit